MSAKEIEEILKTLGGIASGDWIQMLPKEANLLLSYIEQLEKENEKANKYIVFYKDLTEKQNKSLEEFKQENKQLENNRDKAIELLNKLEMQPAYLDCKYYELYGFNEIKNILKGDSDE